MLLQSLYFSRFLPNRPRPLSSFDTHARWQPVTQSARSRRSYGKMEDCEQSIHGTEPGVTGASPGRRTADILYIGVINIPGYSLWAEDVNYLLIGQVTCERTLPLSDCVLVPLVRP